MANRYDDETMKFIETRKRVAHMRREEARRKRNIMIAIIAAVVLVVLIVVIAVAACGGCGSSKEEVTTAETTTVEETTVEETTEEETTSDDEFAEGSTLYTNDGVNLRSEPSADSDDTIIDTLEKGTEVTVVANEGDWIKVKTGGEEGYVKKTFLTKEKLSSDDSDDSDSGSSDDNERTIETRKRTIGTTSKSSSNSSKKSNKDKRTLY